MALPTEDRYIAAAESSLGVGFPASFRAYLLRCNGGEIEALDDAWQVHPVLDTSDVRRLKRSASHIVAQTSAAREWRGFPDGAVSIATDGSGNHLVLLPQKGASSALDDAVHVWWHEGAELEWLAPDFSVL